MKTARNAQKSTSSELFDVTIKNIIIIIMKVLLVCFSAVNPPKSFKHYDHKWDFSVISLVTKRKKGEKKSRDINGFETARSNNVNNFEPCHPLMLFRISNNVVFFLRLWIINSLLCRKRILYGTVSFPFTSMIRPGHTYTHTYFVIELTSVSP